MSSLRLNAVLAVLVLVCASGLGHGVSAAISCKNAQGTAVDYFHAIKLPKLSGEDAALQEGFGFLFGQEGAELELSIPLNKGSALAKTLAPLYSSRELTAGNASAVDSAVSSGASAAGYIVYNDECPGGGQGSQYGHTKGVLIMDSSSGVWLIHSVPNWPVESKNSYPSTETTYGQSFLCLSLDKAQMTVALGQVQYTRPQVCYSSLPAAVKSAYPLAQEVVDGQYISGATASTKQVVTSGGTAFTSMVKTGAWGKELYSAYVNTQLKVGLRTETWRNGVGNLPSYCSGTYHVENVAELSWTGLPPSVGTITYATQKDHSKFAVSTSSSKPYVCVGGINRQQHQEERGGGTVCFQDKELWTQFSKAISQWDKC